MPRPLPFTSFFVSALFALAPLASACGTSSAPSSAANDAAAHDRGTSSGGADAASGASPIPPAGDGGGVADAGWDSADEEKRAVDDNWALRVTRAIEAWQLIRARGRQPGEGVLVAHPDTGTSLHPELGKHPHAPSPIEWSLAHDFVDGDSLPFHDFSALNRIPPHGHGTETSSVLASPLGCPNPEGGAPKSAGPCVTGVAPYVRLVPLRASDSVVLASGEKLAAAVEYAVTIHAHVISISMGGVGDMPALETAIAHALDAGIIVVAAAGNFTGTTVVAPSTYGGVVCVAGVTPDLKPWNLSATGARVDISGPATEVRYAKTTKGKDGGLDYEIALAQGTSDATAITAGAAALWLTYHGRDALLAKYGAAGLPKAFRAIVMQSAFTTPAGWPGGGYGPGILDIVKLLEAPLPTTI